MIGTERPDFIPRPTRMSSRGALATALMLLRGAAGYMERKGDHGMAQYYRENIEDFKHLVDPK